MKVNFAKKIAAAAPLRGRDGPRAGAKAVRERRCDQARLERVAVGAASGGARGGRAGRRRGQPLPRPVRGEAAQPDRRALRLRPGRDRGLERLLRDPARRLAGALRARRRADLRLAGVLDVSADGAALGRPGDPRPARRLRARPRRDAGRGHRRHPAAGRLQPQQPDRHLHPGRADRRLPCRGARPRHRDPRRGLHRAAGDRRPRRDRRPRPPLPEPGPAADLLEGLRARRAALRLRARLRRASAAPSTPSASRSASTCSRRRPGRRRCATATI